MLDFTNGEMEYMPESYEDAILQEQELLEAILDGCDMECTEACPLAEWDPLWRVWTCSAYKGE